MWVGLPVRALLLAAVSWLLPVSAKAQVVAAPRSLANASDPASTTFDFNEVRVEGNSILSEREIDEAIYPFLGPNRTAAQVEQARAALEDAFGKRGFATVSATLPPQQVRDGVVIIKVVQRTVGRLRVVGAQWVAPSVIRAGAPSLAEGSVPNLTAVQADIVGLNALPDRTVTPNLRAGRAPDTVDIDLKVEDKLPLHGNLEINNRQSQSSTPLRLSGSLTYDNLWQRGDSATIGFQVAPQNTADTTVATASYLFRIPDSKMSLLGSYIHSDSRVVTLGNTSVVGKGDIAGLRLLVPLGATDDFTHSLSVGLDYKNITEQVGLGGASNSTPITYYPFTAAYQAGWASDRATTDITTSLVWALRGTGSNTAYFDAKRSYAQGDFAYAKLDASRTQELPYNLQAYARAQAQVSPSPLVSSEQFSAGGVDTVRGYYESEALGDTGGSGQLELRSPPLARYLGGPLTSLRLHAFADAAATEVRQPLIGQHASASLASVGFGARFQLYDHISGSVEDAVTLLGGPATRAGYNHVLFRLTGDF